MEKLAKEFLEGSEKNLEEGRLRIAIDTGYNAIELYLKAFLLLKMDNFPHTHGGVVTKFGELFVKTKEISHDLGRKINHALILRRKSRYDPLSSFENTDGEIIIQTAKLLIQTFEEIEKE